MKVKLVRESINEGAYGKEEVQVWADMMVDVLKNHKVTQFGGELPVEDVKIEFLVDGAADVTGKVNVGDIRFDLYFSLRDVRTGRDIGAKWQSEVSISSPARKGAFTVKATGKNTAPSNLIKMLSNIFDLKYKRR